MTVKILKNGKYAQFGLTHTGSQNLQEGAIVSFGKAWYEDSLVELGLAEFASDSKSVEVPESAMVEPVPETEEPVIVEEEVAESEPEVNATNPAVELATAFSIDLTTVTGSGPGGRILKGDVEKLVSATGD